MLSTDALPVIEGASGFLFIGDPHITSRRPGRRKDDDFTARIMRKLAWCIETANEKNLVPVILGDLYDRPVEPDEGLKTRVLRILRSAKHKVVYILGNHEKSHETLCDGDSLAYLAETGVIDLIKTSSAHAVYQFGAKRIGLGGTPHGEEIPDDVSGMFPACNAVVWLTHHDLQMERPYPGAIPCKEIKGCKLVVNGHMHMLKKPRKEGGTMWFNPGNITRQATDAIEHIPTVYSFDEKGALTAHQVPHEKDVFDLTGSLISAIRVEAEAGMTEEESLESAFVQLMHSEEIEDYQETEDGSVIREMMEAQFEEMQTDNRVRSIVVGLLNEVVEEDA